jgi:DNA-binding NarL/FixJ family response regulator
MKETPITKFYISDKDSYLTPREVEWLLDQGFSAKQIANKLIRSTRTIEDHLKYEEEAAR